MLQPCISNCLTMCYIIANKYQINPGLFLPKLPLPALTEAMQYQFRTFQSSEIQFLKNLTVKTIEKALGMVYN